jgi:hypothetical protein
MLGQETGANDLKDHDDESTAEDDPGDSRAAPGLGVGHNQAGRPKSTDSGNIHTVAD